MHHHAGKVYPTPLFGKEGTCGQHAALPSRPLFFDRPEECLPSARPGARGAILGLLDTHCAIRRQSCCMPFDWVTAIIVLTDQHGVVLLN